MTDTLLIVTVLFGLFTKHLIVDFMLQTPYQYLNKGTYGHPGGLLHSGLQGLTTLAVLGIAGAGPLSWALALADFVIHYHVDWAKVQITRRYKYDMTKDAQYWWWLGIDQYLHSLTYVAIVYIITLY